MLRGAGLKEHYFTAIKEESGVWSSMRLCARLHFTPKDIFSRAFLNDWSPLAVAHPWLHVLHRLDTRCSGN